MYIFSPVIDNYPTWICVMEVMAVEMIPWPISTKECCRTRGSKIFINTPLFTFIYTLLSLKYYAPDTRSSVNICHIILTPVPYSKYAQTTSFFSARFRGETPRKLAEKHRELSRSFSAKFRADTPRKHGVISKHVNSLKFCFVWFVVWRPSQQLWSRRRSINLTFLVRLPKR